MVYVGSYSYTGKVKGITVSDMDVKNGISREKCEMEMDNSSYVIAPSDGKTSYFIVDEGVVSFRVLQNGSLARLNNASIHGMGGYHLCIDTEDKYVFMSGYHDGKTTVLSLNKDDSVGQIVDRVFNKGYGSMAERNFRSYVICTRRTLDGRYVLSVDNGAGQVKVYRFGDKDKRLFQADAIHCDLESAPRHFRRSSDGRFLYLMRELRNVICVYSYEADDRAPTVEKIQIISTTSTKNPGNPTVACATRLSSGEEYAYYINADENIVSIYSRDEKSGLLTMICCLPVSGEYPKDVAIFSDQKHIAPINHGSGSTSSFEVDYEKGLIVMCRRSVTVNEPNCYATAKIGNQPEKIVGLMRQQELVRQLD